jgi:hypothetical protein
MGRENIKSNPMAKDLRQPKYKPRVIPNKKKPTLKIKHKKGGLERDPFSFT